MAKKSPSYAKDPCLMALGLAIRESRQRIAMSQETLALEVEIDRSYLGGIERGEHNVAMINIAKIAARLGLSVSALMQIAGL